MSHFLTISTNENGIILEQRFKNELQTAATDPFAFTDVFPYSHGWGNTASSPTSPHQSTASARGAAGNWGGRHSDIDLPHIYDMLARFFGT